MAVTSPDNIWTPDSGDDYALTTDLAAMADTVQDALLNRSTYRMGTDADRTAASLPNGTLWYSTDTGITYKRLSGSWKAWESDWIAYTATLTNFAPGTLPSGTPRNITLYRYEAGRIRVSYDFVFGSNGSPPSNPRFSLPVASAALRHGYQSVGVGDLWDVSVTQVFFSTVTLVTTTVAQIQYGVTPVIDVVPAGPFVWASGDAMQGELVYDPA